MKLFFERIALIVLAGIVAFLAFRELSRPDTIDYGPDIQKMKEKQIVYDEAIADFNEYKSERDSLRINREIRHETINHVRASNSDSLRRAHLRELLGRTD